MEILLQWLNLWPKLLSSGQSLNILYPYKAEEILQGLNSKGQLKKKKVRKQLH